MRTLSFEEMTQGVTGPPVVVEVQGHGVSLMVKQLPFATVQAIGEKAAELGKAAARGGDGAEESARETMAFMFQQCVTDESGKDMTIEQAEQFVANSTPQFLAAAQLAINDVMQGEGAVKAAGKKSKRRGKRGSGSDSAAT